MAKIALVTGATGLLGREVVKAFERQQWTAIGTGLTRAQPPITKLDLQNEAEIETALEQVNPQVVVHCAANKYPDKCDPDPSAARAINVQASATLARLCAARQILLIYISTDYVFSGVRGEAPYEVTDTPDPPNTYGLTKWEGEQAVLKEYEGKKGRSVALRVPVLYGRGEGPESSVNGLMDTVWKAQEEAEKGGEIKVDGWAKRFPTNTEDVGRVCHDITKRYLDTEDKSSLPTTLQFSSEDCYTKFELCEVFAEIAGLPTKSLSKDMSAEKDAGTTKRPYDAHLSTKALKDLGIEVDTQDFVGWWRRECRAYRK